jgi:glutathione S-transferase
MRMRRVWGRANSSNVMKVVWLLEELRLPYERIDVGGPFGGNDTPEYRAMNPNGVVPTLEEDGFVLWESNAICRYLCAANASNSPLWPQDARSRANIDRWMDWQQTTLGPPQTVVFQGLVRTPPERRDNEAIARGVEKAGQIWGLLDRYLARHDFVAGPDFTLADIPLGPHAHRWFSFAIDRPEAPNLRAWYERLLRRPAFRAHVAMPLS